MQIVDLYRDHQKCPTGEVTLVYHQQCAMIRSTPFIINIMNNLINTHNFIHMHTHACGTEMQQAKPLSKSITSNYNKYKLLL